MAVPSCPSPRVAVTAHGLSWLIFKFPPNFVCQLSTKARRNCSNIGVAQIVAASWSENQADARSDGENVKLEGSPSDEYASFFSHDGSVAIHAGTYDL